MPNFSEIFNVKTLLRRSKFTIFGTSTSNQKHLTMRKGLYRIVLSCSLLILAQSCWIKDSRMVSHFICAYYEFGDIATYVCDTTLDGNNNITAIQIEPFFETVSPLQVTSLNFLSGSYNKKAFLFDSLANANNDNSYKPWRMTPMGPAGPHFYNTPGAVVNHPAYIEITCDNDWDQNHPAKSNLNDLFDITYYAYWPFIKSHYNTTHLESDSNEALPVTKPLTELEQDDLKLLSITGLFKLETTRIPQTPGRYNISICAYDSDSTEYLRGSCYFVIR